MGGRVTIFTSDGGDEAVAGWRSMSDEAGAIAAEHGGMGHIVARDGDDVIVINLWRSAEGSDAMAADPRVRELLARHGYDGPPPGARFYEIVHAMFVEENLPITH